MGKSESKQQYDDYWKLTVEYSDIHGDLFNNILKYIIRFIDKFKLNLNECTPELNKQLQEEIFKINPKKDMGSVRKSINQFIKLGFVKPGYRGYHPVTKKFLRCTDSTEKELLFTQIFYEAASFNSSYSVDDTDVKQVNFLLKTLAYKGYLYREDIMGLMVTDIRNYKRGYLLPEELVRQSRWAKSIGFDEKKYNQIDYLIGFLKYMPDLVYGESGLRFVDSVSVVSGNDVITPTRDPIMMRIFRKKLMDESNSIYDNVLCYASKLPWKALVASHIKPLSQCLMEGNTVEAYDKNNGLLLCGNIDAYFDKFDISFDEKGKIMIPDEMDKGIKEIIKDCCIDKSLLTNERLLLLDYHRTIYNRKHNK